MRLRSLLLISVVLCCIGFAVAESTHAETAHPNIVGGNEATPNEFPWQVAVTSRWGNPHCGGSLIAPNWVVTAAHCVTGGAASIRAELGIHDLYQLANNPYRQSFTIKRSITHPKYSSVTGDYDIALIELNGTATLNAAVQPIALASPNQRVLYTPSSLTDASNWPIVSGWGNVSYSNPPKPGTCQTSRYLCKVAVPIVSNATCDTNYGGGITDRMVCAGLPQGGIDSCQGDSGGPLFINDSGTPVLIGIVSMGEGCALPNYPGIYANVANLYAWVADNVTISPLPTYTPSLTPTASNTRTATGTGTTTKTRTATSTTTPSYTCTSTTTATPSRTWTVTRTSTTTATASNTRTSTKTATASNTRTNTKTATNTKTPSLTPTWTHTKTPSNTRTATRTATLTATATMQPEWMRRVPNGNFEGVHTAWAESSLKYPDVITRALPILRARSGQYFVWLAGANDDVSSITQTIRVRADAPFLRIHYLAASDEPCGTIQNDTARVYANDTLLPGGSIPLCKGQNVASWRALTFNLASYAEQNVTVRIEVRTNSTLVSSLWIDDVGFVRSATELLSYYGHSITTTGPLVVQR